MSAERSALGSDVTLEAFQLFRMLGFESLAEALNLAGEEQEQVQYMAGVAMGRALVRKGRVQGGDLPAAIASFTTFYQTLGLGLVSSREEHGDLLLAIGECAGCAGNEPNGRAICFVEAGLVSGLISEVSGREYQSQEGRCIGGLGDDVCEFRLTEGKES